MAVVDLIFICLLLPIFGSHGLHFRQEEVNKTENIVHKLETKLKKFGDEILGITNIERIYEKEKKSKTGAYDAQKHLEDMTRQIGSRLNETEGILRKNKEFIEKNLAKRNSTNSCPECCTAYDYNLLYYKQFGRDNYPETCCGNNERKIGIGFWNESSSLFRRNLERTPFLLWQYYGDISGNYIQYPADTRMCKGNTSLDARFQDWYVYTASPKKKNVVVIIDASGSMSMAIGFPDNPNTPTRQDIAKEAAKTVLDTLSPTDYAGIVAFNDTTRSSKCTSMQPNQTTAQSSEHDRFMVIQATKDNKKTLKKFINGISSTGSTFYGVAFNRAFGLLNKSRYYNPKQFEDSLNMILFLTDGAPNENPKSLILEAIAKGQKSMNNSVYVFVYGFGREINGSGSNSDKAFLIKLADQNNLKLLNVFGPTKDLEWPSLSNHPDNSRPTGPTGNYFFISDSDAYQLKGTMGKYYAQFPMSKHREPRISLPHTDPSVGQVVTFGLPTVDASGDFHGVVSLDISVGQAFYEVQNFHYGSYSYAFLVGDSGKVIIHPDIPKPYQLQQQPTFYRVDQMEPDLSTEAVNNITKGIPGEESVMKSLFNPRRKSRETKQVTYLYQPVPGFEGTYSIVMVLFDDDLKLVHIQPKSSTSFPQFLYHRLDFLENDTLNDYGVCSRDNMLVLPGNSTIKFSPGSFINPEKNLLFEQNSSYSELLMNAYNNSKDFSDHTGVTDSAVSDVLITLQLDPYWMRQHDVIWRYLGTENGLFKVYPGTLVPDIQYDPREDSWYREAMDQRQEYIFMDTSHTVDSKNIITVAKAFHETKSSVHGVVAADINKQHFITFIYNSITNLTSPDLDTYVFNRKGYAVVKLTTNGSTETYPVKEHMSRVLPHVADWLIQQGILVATWCTDMANGHSHLTYHIDTNGQSVVPITSDPCLDIILLSVNNTNLFILAHKKSLACDTRKVRRTCSCTIECNVCSSNIVSNCQCPCTCQGSALVDTCLNTIDHSVGYIPCTGTTKHWRTYSKQSNNATANTNLTTCQPSCTTITNSSECLTTSGCNWCRTGHYKTYPLCSSQRCVHDRKEIVLQSLCDDLSSMTSEETRELTDTIYNYAVNKTSSYKNAQIKRPHSIQNRTVKFYIENLDEKDVPASWIKEFMHPFEISVNISGIHKNLTFVGKGSSPTDYRITLHTSGTNLTSELQTALTLRSYIASVIKKLTKKVFSSEVANSVSGIWPDEEEISFIISKPTTMKFTVFEQQRRKLHLNSTSFPNELDLLGRKVKITSITTRGSFQSVCNLPCSEFSAADHCNDHTKCHWDLQRQICTDTPLLSERIHASVYFPCMGLYKKMKDTEQDILLTDFKEKLLLLVNPGSNDSIHSFRIIKDDTLIGRQIDFTIQGRLHDPSVSETWWKIKHELNWNMNFSISDVDAEFKSSVKPTSYEEFTSMLIIMVIPGLDVDHYLDEHPLTGRREIIKSVRSLARKHLLPPVSNTVTNIWMKGDLVPFLISKPAFSTTDLRQEYTRIKQSAEDGFLSLTLDGSTYQINTTFFVGSFWQICPRTCDMVEAEMECSSIPGCYWSDLETPPHCSNDSLLHEKVEITVLYPCAGFHNLTEDGRNFTLITFENEVKSYLSSLSHRALHSFGLGQDYGDSLVFTIQRTLLGPALSKTITNITEWISKGNLLVKTRPNNSYVQGEAAEDYDSVEVALEYRKVNFDNITLANRRKVAESLRLQVQAILPSDLVLLDGNIWFDQNFALFTLIRKRTSIKIESELKRIQKLVSLGGLSVYIGGAIESPTHVKYQNRLTKKCPQQCLNTRNMASHCNRTNGCFRNGSWHIDNCNNNTYLSNSYIYQLFIPCNATQSLNSSERQEAELDLHNELAHLLDPVPDTVITDVDINDDGADITLHATTLYPHLDRYIATLVKSVDYKYGFSFGPVGNSDLLVPREPTDYTNVEMMMCFSSIDFNAMISSMRASEEVISMEMIRQLNRILLGEIMHSYRTLRIYEECITFELKKDKHSIVSMADQVQKIRDEVDKHHLILDLHYIRPVMATSVDVKGNFKELCPERYPEFTHISSTPTIVATNFGYNYSQVTTGIVPTKPAVILIYNGTEVTRREIQRSVDNSEVDACFVDIRLCTYCLSYFSRQTCSFLDLPNVSPTGHVPTSQIDPDIGTQKLPTNNGTSIGPVQITIITVSSFFMLALALWAIDYVRQMKKNPKKESSPPKSKNQGAGTGGRSIEVIPEES